MTIIEQEQYPTPAEIAVRALDIWKREWVPQEFQTYYLELAKDELLAERFLDDDERAAEV